MDSISLPDDLPPGITLSYLAESRDRAPTTAIIFIGSFALVLALLRSYARLFLVKSFGVDDWLAIATLVRSSLILLSSEKQDCVQKTVLEEADVMIADLYCFSCIIPHAYPTRLWQAHRVYTVHPKPFHDERDRNLGLRCPSSLHNSPLRVPVFRVGVLPPHHFERVS